MSKRAVIYCRVSTAVQEDDGTSLETQEMEGRKYCVENGYRVVEVLREVHTGTELDERPEMSKLRAMVRAGQVDVIVVWTFDRLARNMVHQGVILYELDKAGVTVESVRENLDDTLEGRLLRQVVAYMAEKEHQRIKERTQAGIRRRVEHGKPLLGGVPLYGYAFNEDRTGYIENPETAAVVRRIFEMVAAGVTFREICRTFAREGIPSPRGSAVWETRPIALIIDNPAYWGKAAGFRWSRAKVKSKDGTHTYIQSFFSADAGVPLPESACPALVDEELAVKAREVRRSRNGGTQPRKYPIPLLLGFVVCGDCGRKCSTTHNHTKTGDVKHYYQCHSRTGVKTCINSTPGRALEEKVWAWVVECVKNKDIELTHLMQQVKDLHRQTHEARERERDAEDDYDALVLAYAREERENNRRDLEAAMQKKKMLVEGYRKEHEKREEDLQEAMNEYLRAQRNLDRCADLLETGEDVEERRFVLRLLGVRVRVYKTGGPRSKTRAEAEMAPWTGEEKCVLDTAGSRHTPRSGRSACSPLPRRSSAARPRRPAHRPLPPPGTPSAAPAPPTRHHPPATAR